MEVSPKLKSNPGWKISKGARSLRFSGAFAGGFRMKHRDFGVALLLALSASTMAFPRPQALSEPSPEEPTARFSVDFVRRSCREHARPRVVPPHAALLRSVVGVR